MSAYVQQETAVAFHGLDRQGKDGQLAKMGFDLAQLYHELQAHKATGAKQTFISSSRLMPVRKGYVTIDAVAEQDGAAALQAALEALGLQNGARAGRVVSGRLPIDAIPEAAALTSLRFARPAMAMTSAGNAVTEGDAAVKADDARANLGVDGSGFTVGVLSDSYDTDGSAGTHASDDVASSDLPAGVAVLEDYGDDSGENDDVKDEGRAMLQIIHDVAPGAGLAFHTAFGGQANFANGIQALATNADADIIVDDVLYFREPMFQDGIIAQAIDEVKNNDGVAYFSAAGNFADQSWEEQFIGSGQDGPLGDSNGELHLFEGSQTCQLVTVPQDKTITFIFQWNEPYASAGTGNPGSSSDVDIFVRDKQEGSVIVSSEDANVGTDPIEVLDFENDGSTDADNDGTPDVEFCFGIELQAGVGPGVMKYVYGADDSGISVASEGESTLYGHANAKGAMAVGAARHNNTSQVEPFSAKGGTPILFDAAGNRLMQTDARQKPNIVGPDCVSTTFFSGGTFCGTSAAAPHAAGVAALMLENRSGLTVDDVYDVLKSTAIDMANTAFTGSGFIQADQAALPVELVAFDAVTTGRDVILSWQTASETNNAGFHIERRQDDGTFERLDFVRGAGTTTEAQSYQHRVSDLAPGRYAFRLQQIDTDGTVHPSPVVEATVALEAAYQLSAMYPNPVRTAATLELLVREPQTVHAVVYDAIGRRVQTLHDGPVAAHEPVPLTLRAEMLSSGLYLVYVHGETFSATRRATVVR